MRAKKLLALALAGMALTTCLSGCDRTIIEHQFHTNTEYVTGEETSSPEIERNLGALTNIFFSRDTTLSISMVSTLSNNEMDMDFLKKYWGDYGVEDESDIVADVDDEIVKAFVCDELEDSYGIQGFVLFQEYGAESECDSFTSAYSKLLGILNEKLKLFLEEDWGNTAGDSFNLFIYNMYMSDLDNKTYAAVILER